MNFGVDLKAVVSVLQYREGEAGHGSGAVSVPVQRD